MVKLYKTKSCAVCVGVAKYLTRKGVSFEEVYVDNDFETRIELQQKTSAMTVPIIQIGENYVVGANFGRIAQLLG